MLKHLQTSVCIAAYVSLVTGCMVGDEGAEVSDDSIDSVEDGVADDATDVLEEMPDAKLDSVTVETIAAMTDPALAYDTQERALLGVINDQRAVHGLTPLRVSAAETRRAFADSTQMAASASVYTDGDRPAYYARAATVHDMFEQLKTAPMMYLDGTDRRIGIARVQGADGAWYWTAGFNASTEATLSVGIPSIANNNLFEYPGAVTWPMAYEKVRTLGKWFLDGVEFTADLHTEAKYSGSYGLTLADEAGGRVTATQVVRATANVHYRLSVMVMPKGGMLFGHHTARVQFLDKDFKRLGGAAVDTGTTTTWHRITTAPTVAPAGTRYARILLGETNLETETGTFYYDNVRLEAF